MAFGTAARASVRGDCRRKPSGELRNEYDECQLRKSDTSCARIFEIDDAVLEAAMRAGPFTTKKDAVEAGLKLLARQATYRGVLKWEGKLQWDGDEADALVTPRRRTRHGHGTRALQAQHSAQRRSAAKR